MKKRAARGVLALLLLLATSFLPAHAAHVGVERAEEAVKTWLARSDWNKKPFGEAGGDFCRIGMYDERGEVSADRDALFYVACLDPLGLVMIPAEDLIEPIYAFIPESDEYWADDEEVVHGIIAADLCAKIRTVRRSAGLLEEETRYQKKWRALLDNGQAAGEPATTGMRVPPLLRTKWGQDYPEDDEDFHVFSYYTPRNYPAGCTATAMAQVMRHFEHPRDGIGAKRFEISVNGRWRRAWTRGGDGKGGPYDWTGMPDAPDEHTSIAPRKSVGALLYDVGIAIESEYEKEVTYAFVGDVAIQLVKTFQYGNTIGASLENGIDHESAALAINPNLDAGIPLPVGIYCQTEPEGGDGHALVCDGYAYDMGTMYYHFNMGMDGLDDLWIAMPDDGLTGEVRLIDEIAYNIYPGKNHGEIVSGRVLDEDGKPLAGVSVNIRTRGFAETARSNERGIFAFTGVPSNRALELKAEANGEVLATAAARTRKSVPTYYEEGVSEMAVGNVWGILLRRK